MPELDFVTSESRTGVSIVLVNIKESYTDMRPIWDNFRRKIDDMVGDLPEGAGTPVINDEFGDVYGVVMTLSGEGFNYAELQQIADRVKDELLRIPDAAKVDILGEQEERIFVEYDNARLAELGISPYQLSQMLSARNIVISGGAFNLNNERIALEPSGNFESIEDIGKTVVSSPKTNRLIMLRDITKISRGYVDPATSLIHTSGKRGLAIAVSMRKGGNNIELGVQVKRAMAEFLQTYPHGVEFDLINFSPAEVDKKVSDFVGNLLQAVLVVTAVMLLTLKLRLIENGPAVSNPIELRISGTEPNALFDAVEQIRQEMLATPTLQNVTDDWGQRIKKLQIDIDQVRAQSSGVTSHDIAISLQSSLSGMELTEYREGEDTIPVLLRSSEAGRREISKVESLSVYSQSTGNSVPLSQVANVNMVWDLAKIYRRNSLRTFTLGAQLVDDANAAEVVNELRRYLHGQQKQWGPGIKVNFGGEHESSAKANQSIAEKLGLAGLIILILLVAQFNSVRKSIIVLSTIPLGLIGVVLGLLIARSYVGFMTILGIVSLSGIVINNAIVLLERIQIELNAGLTQHQAIITAAQQRARPILLTTATTVLGLIPLYLGGGPMWEPMSVAIMGGLLFSTLLTLGVIPVLYASLFRVRPAVK